MSAGFNCVPAAEYCDAHSTCTVVRVEWWRPPESAYVTWSEVCSLGEKSTLAGVELTSVTLENMIG